MLPQEFEACCVLVLQVKQPGLTNQNIMLCMTTERRRQPEAGLKMLVWNMILTSYPLPLLLDRYQHCKPAAFTFETSILRYKSVHPAKKASHLSG